jgi:hypothetical protein
LVPKLFTTPVKRMAVDWAATGSVATALMMLFLPH